MDMKHDIEFVRIRSSLQMLGVALNYWFGDTKDLCLLDIEAQQIYE